ncbi:MAG: carboxypeptidase-like regulatory domain-containing protein, partial [Chitinophagales bacterium]
MRKFLLFCWLFCGITVFLNAKNNGKENRLLSKKVTMEIEDVSVEEVLKELSKKCEVRFSYSKNLVAVGEKVDVDFEDKSLRFILEEILEPIGAGYKVLGKRIILKPLPKDAPRNMKVKTPVKKAILRQVIRGRVIDKDTKNPIISANVVVKDSEPFMGSVTDLDGYFKLPDVAVGRHSLLVSYLGYESKTLSNLLIGAGKELVLEIGLRESFIEMEVIEVSATNKQKAKPINEMALISARSVSVEETKRYAAGISDPARTVTAYAGVMGGGDLEENAVIIRGNSPRGILWRLEGVEIPNPNHFASEGTSNGAIGILSTNVIARSDFYTGAFPAEFGNALSGVFDLKLRTGNNEKREYTAQVGMLGVEAALEGPFRKGGGASYLVNYRYSTLSLLNQLGVNIAGGSGNTNYQDIAFKFHFPTQKGYFSLYGIGGKSSHWETFDISGSNFLDVEEERVGVLGLSNLHIINDKTYLKSTLSLSGTKISDLENDLLFEPVFDYTEKLKKTFVKANVVLNSKINTQNVVEMGLTYTNWRYNFNTRALDIFSAFPFNDYSIFDSKGT